MIKGSAGRVACQRLIEKPGTQTNAFRHADVGNQVLALWLERNEGAKFWLRVMKELKNRGTEDIRDQGYDQAALMPPLNAAAL